jgi:flagellar export protein FliJ
MRAFRYRFATLEKLAERAHDAAAAELAKARLALDSKRAVAATIAANRRRTGRAAPEPGITLTAARLQVIQKRQEKLAVDLGRAKAAVTAHERIVAQRQKKRAEAEREVKKHEILRARRHASWLFASNREEQRRFDEIAGLRARLRAAPSEGEIPAAGDGN